MNSKFLFKPLIFYVAILTASHVIVSCGDSGGGKKSTTRDDSNTKNLPVDAKLKAIPSKTLICPQVSLTEWQTPESFENQNLLEYQHAFQKLNFNKLSQISPQDASSLYICFTEDTRKNLLKEP